MSLSIKKETMKVYKTINLTYLDCKIKPISKKMKNKIHNLITFNDQKHSNHH
jgi:predicted ester cyclase